MAELSLEEQVEKRLNVVVNSVPGTLVDVVQEDVTQYAIA